jgi:hypothetical protein
MKPLFRLLTALLLSACAATAQPSPDQGFTFALIGDTPYNRIEVLQLDALIDELNRQDLAFVIHVGDITSGRGPCSDAWFDARKRQFERSRHPFVLVPGDNDWADCSRTGYDAFERLAHFRTLFHAGNQALGQRGLALERQSADPAWAEFREHVRWTTGKVMFIGLNVPGGNNNFGRSPEADAEYARRSRAVLAWMTESLALAKTRKLAGAVIFVQGDPDLGKGFDPVKNAGDGYLAFRTAVRDLAVSFDKPLLFVHGDGHIYTHNQPLSHPVTGERLKNFTRVEVFGSPQVRWVRARVDPASPKLFDVAPAPWPGPTE